VNKKEEAAWWVKNFPTAHARDVADRAIDCIDPKKPMTTFLDIWLAAYIKAGGKTKHKL
jgi:hypothetical protein